jgi:hypothetical protein
VRIGVLIRFPQAIQVTKEPSHVGPADHFADHPDHSDRLRDVPAHVFRGLVEAMDHPYTELSRWE